MRKLIISLITIIAFVACSDSGTDNNGNNNGGQDSLKQPQISLDASEANFTAEGGSIIITITSSEVWTAQMVNSRADEWCSINPTNGSAGNSSITITAAPNDTPYDRTATVIISAGSVSKTINVSQKQKDALTVTSSKFEVTAEGGEITIEVNANIEFDFKIDDDAKVWITHRSTRAMKTSHLVFEIEKNESPDKRKANITIVSDNIKEAVTIYQEGHTSPTIVLSDNEFIVSSAPKTIAVEVKSSVDVTVEIPSNINWISENTTRGVSTNTYYFDIAQNEDYDSRTAEIKFSNKENNISETVEITQLQQDAIILAKTEYEIEAEGDEIEFEIQTNVDFVTIISENARDWIRQIETRALETKVLRFFIFANPSPESRQGLIYFSNGEITQSVTIKQKPADDVVETASEVVKWMDERLQKEYMWLDEYNQKHSSFDLSLGWNVFIDKTLSRLTTNTDDGGTYNGQRSFYTYVSRTKVSNSTRASWPTVMGYGLDLSSYVVGVQNIEGYEPGNYGFVIEHAYPGSAAAEAGIDRGDVILQINGKKISNSNYQTLWSLLQDTESASGVMITAEVYDEEVGEYNVENIELTASDFERNPVAYCNVLTVDEKYGIGDKNIGYMSYLAFDGDFDNALVEAMQSLAEEGVTDMILDLRVNGGGHVNSSILLASMLLDESYVGDDKIYARLKHNPNNKVYSDMDLSLERYYRPSDQSSLKDLPNIGIKKLWVICSEFTASASEMLIVGLRGLDVEVELIGNVTEGKNCGMEVTYKNFDGYEYEFAPITFMNENGKGFSDYGDGITPEHHLAAYANDSSIGATLQSQSSYFPIPLTVWGDVSHDIALSEAVMQICGKSLFTSSSDAQASASRFATTRAGGKVLPERINKKIEHNDLRSRGMIIVKE